MSHPVNTAIIEGLIEELVMLDEVAGELDPISNFQIEQRRKKIKQELIELGETL